MLFLRLPLANGKVLQSEGRGPMNQDTVFLINQTDGWEMTKCHVHVLQKLTVEEISVGK